MTGGTETGRFSATQNTYIGSLSITLWRPPLLWSNTPPSSWPHRSDHDAAFLFLFLDDIKVAELPCRPLQVLRADNKPPRRRKIGFSSDLHEKKQDRQLDPGQNEPSLSDVIA
ncbi:hypothetical protein TWF281_001832 [Arthrobotrys megalospora]